MCLIPRCQATCPGSIPLWAVCVACREARALLPVCYFTSMVLSFCLRSRVSLGGCLIQFAWKFRVSLMLWGFEISLDLLHDWGKDWNLFYVLERFSLQTAKEGLRHPCFIPWNEFPWNSRGGTGAEHLSHTLGGFPHGTSGKEPPCWYRGLKRHGFVPSMRRFHGGGHGNPLQYSGLENPMDITGGLQSMRSQRVRHDCTYTYVIHMFP